MAIHAINVSGSSTSTGSFGAGYIDNKLGIGTTSPSQLMHVYGTDEQADFGIRIGAAVKYWDMRFIGSTSGDYDGNFQLRNNTLTALTVLKSGNVGIGTTSPAYQLTLGGNAVGSTEGLRINDPSNAAYGAHFSFSDTPNEVWIGGITNNTYNSAIGIHREATRSVTIDVNNNVGINDSIPTYKLDVNGTFRTTGAATFDSTIGSGAITSTAGFSGTTGTFSGKVTAASKSFLINHPTKKGKKLEHGSLEGPENGVYVRGKVEKNNVIELPEYWTGLVNEDTITVQLTPMGSFQKLYVKEIKDNKVYVEKSGFGKPSFFYNVYGERKDIEKMKVEH